MTISRWELHKREWRNCKRCSLCQTRRKVVLARGSLPCDVLFVGEAPGRSENALGEPFCGPAGVLLQRIIDTTLRNRSYSLTNLIACIPLDEEGEKLEDPPEESILACRPRLSELIDIANSQVIIAVGKLAEEYLPVDYDAAIVHPAAILRADVSQKGLAVQRCITTISDVVQDIN